MDYWLCTKRNFHFFGHIFSRIHEFSLHSSPKRFELGRISHEKRLSRQWMEWIPGLKRGSKLFCKCNQKPSISHHNKAWNLTFLAQKPTLSCFNPINLEISYTFFCALRANKRGKKCLHFKELHKWYGMTLVCFNPIPPFCRPSKISCLSGKNFVKGEMQTHLLFMHTVVVGYSGSVLGISLDFAKLFLNFSDEKNRRIC